MRFRTLITFIAAYCVIAGFSGCSCEDDPLPHITEPFNLTIEINDGLATTRDTLLRVKLTGENVYQYQISTDSTFEGVEWTYLFNDIEYLAVPAVEGIVTVYARFASSSGGITEKISDDIYIDFTATIHQFDVLADVQPLHTGDRVIMILRTGEEGTATVSFANAILNFPLEYIGDGIFSDTIYIPHGLNGNAARTIAYFTDAAGNVADAVFAPQTLDIAGTDLMPRIVGSVGTEWVVGYEVSYSGGHCFVGYESYVDVIDLRNLTRPVYSHRVDCGDYVAGMEGDGSNLFVARGSQLVVVDIRPPESASVVERKEISGNARGVYLDYPFAYVATLFEGMQIKDIRSPQDIRDYSQLTTNFTGEHICVNIATAYMIGDYGLTVVNIRNRQNPRFISELIIPGNPLDVAFYGNRLYIPTLTTGIVVVNVTDPQFPEIEREFTNFGSVYDLIISPPYMYVSGEDNIRIVNITDPNLPVVSRIGDIENCHGMFLLDRHLIVAGKERLYVVELFR